MSQSAIVLRIVNSRDDEAMDWTVHPDRVSYADAIVNEIYQNIFLKLIYNYFWFWFWTFWFINQQDSLTNIMFADVMA